MLGFRPPPLLMRGVPDTTLCDTLKFISDLRQVGGFLQVPPPIKADRHVHDIT